MISERLARMTANHGEQAAVVDGPETIAWRDLARRKASFARFLRRRAGVRPGDVVASCLANCWEFIVGSFAAAEIGAIWMPVNPQWRGREVAWLAGRLPISCVVTSTELGEPWLGLGDALPRSRVIPVDGAEAAGALAGALSGTETDASGGEAPWREQPLIYLLTSGSTGRPRIVPRSHRGMLVGVSNVAAALGVEPGMRFLGVAPFHHATGFGNTILLALLHGAAVVVMRKFHPRMLAEVVGGEKIGVINGSPFIFRSVADSVSDPGAFQSLKICTSAGAAMPPPVTRRCRERLGFEVRQLYGSSEVGTVSIEARGSGVEGAAGKPLPQVEVRLLRPDGSEAPPGEPGEIVVRSPAMTGGYFDEPELNRQAFVNGFFRTGDQGRFGADGNLFIVGRLKKLINAGGVKVDPGEIEQVLAAMPQVGSCRVTGISGSGQTEVVAAQIAVRAGAALSRASVLEHLRSHLAEYKIPRVIEILDALPEEVSGKTPAPWSRMDQE
jgi:long-chain acyl-CoA synthetase